MVDKFTKQRATQKFIDELVELRNGNQLMVISEAIKLVKSRQEKELDEERHTQ